MNNRLDQTVTRLLADGYSQKILCYTYKRPMSAQKLSKMCKIPIAACYRRIHELTKAGLITVADEKTIYKGRKVKLYRCRLKSASLRFSGGKFVINYHTRPEEELTADESTQNIPPEKPENIIPDDGGDEASSFLETEEN